MRDYHINVFYSDEDEAYIADIPDLPLCSAFGETAEAAVHEVLIARDLWIEVATEDGRPKHASAEGVDLVGRREAAP